MSVPAIVSNFVVETTSYPVALIGCRITELSLGCCEYDFAVFGGGNNRIVQVGGHEVELIHLDKPPKNYAVELGGMEIMKDSNKFALSSAAADITDKYKKSVAAAGKKSLVSSLFCQQKMSQAKHPVAAATWLKIAAYDFLKGAIALSGRKPMPLHELEQLRQNDCGAAEGIDTALECIGIERATRPAISRSVQAVMELKSKDYDKKLFASKVDHLLEKRMLADCYYFAGRIAAKNLAERNELFYSRYAKLVQLALDLSSDMQHLENLEKKLSRATKDCLKT